MFYVCSLDASLPDWTLTLELESSTGFQAVGNCNTPGRGLSANHRSASHVTHSRRPVAIAVIGTGVIIRIFVFVTADKQQNRKHIFFLNTNNFFVEIIYLL